MSALPAPQLVWIRQQAISTAGEDEPRIGNTIELDSNNNVYGIYFTNSVASGGTPIGSYDLVFYKLDSAGNVVWIRQNNATSSASLDYLVSITVDSTGAPIGGTIIDGTMSGQAASGGNDVAIVKLDTDGNGQWIRQSSVFNTSGQDYYPSLGTDSSNNIYMALQSQVSDFKTRVVKYNSAGTYQWTSTLSDVSGGASQPCIAVAPNGNVYVAFHCNGTIAGETRTSLGLDSAQKIIVAKMNSSGTVQWTRQSASFNASGENTLVRIAIDANENVYGAYQTDGALSGSTNQGSTDSVVFKLDSSGNTLWARQLFNTSSAENNVGIAASASGKVYVGYHTAGTVSGGTARGSDDIVLLGFDTDGNNEFTYQTGINTAGADAHVTVRCNNVNEVFVSFRTSGATSGQAWRGSTDVAVAKFFIKRRRFDILPAWIVQNTNVNTAQTDINPRIAIDSSGNSIVAQMAGDTGAASGGTTTGSWEVVLTKYNSSGAVQWIKQNPSFQTSAEDAPLSVATDASGNIYLGMYTTGTLSGGTNTGLYDGMIAKFDSNGNTLWTRQTSLFNTTSNDSLGGLSIDASGNVYAVLTLSATISGGTYSGGEDVGIIKFSSDGGVLWTRQLGPMNTAGSDIGGESVLDASGNLYVLYTVTGTISGGAASGNSDVAIAKLNPNGALVWTRQYAALNTAAYGESVHGIAIDRDSGFVYICYTTSGTVSGGTNVSVGSTDVVVAKLDLNGNLIWIRQTPYVINQSGNDGSPTLAVDIFGNPVLGFVTEGTVSGGTSAGSQDVVLAILDPDGNIYVTYQQPVLNTTGADSSLRMAYDPSGYIVGTYQTGGVVSSGTGLTANDVVVFRAELRATFMASAPQNLAATFVATPSSREVRLTWTSEGYRYNVYRDTQVSGATKSLLARTSASSYVDTTVELGRTYYYFVSGSNYTTESALSSPVLARGNIAMNWIVQPTSFNTSGQDINPKIAVDSSGNIIVQHMTLTNAASSGTALGIWDNVVAKFSSSGVLQWVKQNSSFNTGSEDGSGFLTIDASNNIIFGIYTEGTLSGQSKPGSFDAAVIKMDTNGNTLWTLQSPLFNTVLWESSQAATTDAAGNIYAAFSTQSTISGGTSAGSDDFTLAKIAPAGAIVWTKQLRAMNTSGADGATSIMVDASGNVYTMSVVGAAVSGGISSGGNDISFAKLDGNGNLVWVRQYTQMNTSGAESGRAVLDARNQFLYAAYTTAASVSGGTNVGSTDIVVAKLELNGNLLWMRQLPNTINTSAAETSPSIVVDVFGNPIVAYLSEGTVSGGTNLGLADVVIAQFDANGNLMWTHQNALLNASATQSNLFVAYDPNGYLVGIYQISAAISGGTHLGSSDSVIYRTVLGSDLTASPPAGARVSRTSSTVNRVSWTDEGVRYNVYRDIQASGATKVLVGSVFGSFYDDTPPVTSAPYYYFVSKFYGNESPLANLFLDGVSSNAVGVKWIRTQSNYHTGASGDNAYMKTDYNGNSYIAYHNSNTVSGGTASGGSDIVVAKYDANGNPIWMKQLPVMNTSSSEYVAPLDVDASGNVYLSYVTEGTISGGTKVGGNDIAVAKLDANGALVWVRQNVFTSTTASDSNPRIRVDSAGNAYVCAVTTSAASGGTNIGGNDVYVFKLDTNGSTVWVRQQGNFNTASNIGAPVIGVDASGSSYIAYHSPGTVSSGSQIGSDDVIVFKLDTNGTLVWTRQTSTFNTNQFEQTPSIAVDLQNNVHVVYQTQGTLSGNPSAQGGWDVGIVKFDASGNTLWVRQIRQMNSGGSEYNLIAAVDYVGYLYIGYQTTSALSSGTFVGGADLAVAKVDPRGDLVWSKQLPRLATTVDENLFGVGTDGANIYISYTTSGTVSGQSKKSGNEVILAKIGPLESPATPQITFIRDSPITNGFRIGWTNDGFLYNLYRDTQSSGATRVPIRGLLTAGTVDDNTVRSNTQYYYSVTSAIPRATGPVLEWIKQAQQSTSANESTPVVVTDANGSVYTAFLTAGSVSGGSNLGSTDVCVAKYDRLGNLVWIRQAANTSSAESSLNSIAVDQFGGVVVSYTTEGTLSGGTQLGSGDVVVLKLDGNNGGIVWTRQLATTTADLPSYVGVDGAAAVYVAYQTAAGVSGGTFLGSSDLVVAKYDSLGSMVWMQQRAPFNTTATEELCGLSVGADGNVIVTFQTTGTISGGTNRGSTDIVVMKLSTFNGGVLWIRQHAALSTTAAEQRAALDVDVDNNVYLAYMTAGTVSGGTLLGTSDIVVAKLDSNGALVWIRQNASISTAPADAVPSLCVDQFGNAYVMYETSGTPSGSTGAGSTDIVVLKMTATGDVAWILNPALLNTSSADTLSASVHGISIDQYGNLFVAYETAGTTSSSTLVGAKDAVVAKFSQYEESGLAPWTPAHILATPLSWIRQIPAINTSSSEGVGNVDTDSENNVYMAYSTGGVVSGGLSAGGSDVVIAKFTSGGSLIWNRQIRAINTSANEGGRIAVNKTDNTIYGVYSTGGVASGGAVIGGSDTVVFKMNSNGDVLWVKQQAVQNTTSNDTNPSIAVDRFGNAYVAYYAYTTASGGTYMGAADIVVFKLDTNGNNVWIKQHSSMNSSGEQSEPFIGVDSAGNSYIAYSVSGVPISSGIIGDRFDFAVVKLDADGNLAWIRQNNPSGTTGAYTFPGSIAVDPSGNSYTVFTSTYTIIGGEVAYPAMTQAVIKYDTNGAVVWAKQLRETVVNSETTSTSPRIALDALRNVYVVARNRGNVISGGGNMITSGSDIYAYVLDDRGRFLWSKQLAVMNTVAGSDLPNVAVDGEYGIYIMSYTSGTTSGGTNMGSNDIVLMKFSQEAPILSPTGLIVREGGASGGAELSWTYSGFQTRIYRDVQPSGATRVLVETATVMVTTYTDTAIRAGQPYYYFLAAYQVGVEGPLSAPVYYAGTPMVVQWIRQLAAFNTNQNDTSPVFATDASNNIYVAYITAGNTSGGTLQQNGDVVVVKLTSGGAVVWIKQVAPINSPSSSETNVRIATTASGTIYLAYSATGTISGGTRRGQWDTVVAKLDTSGNVAWIVQNPNASTVSDDYVDSIVVDNSENVYVASVVGNAVSGGTFLGGSWDVAIAKYSSSGALVWVRQAATFNTTGTEDSVRMGVDASGNVYVCVRTTGTVSGASSNSGSNDLAVYKMDSNGSVVWIKQHRAMNTGGSEGGNGFGFDIDPSGNLYVAYTTTSTVSGGTLLGSTDIAVAKMDSYGNLIYIRQQPALNTTVAETDPVVRGDADGNCFVVYTTAGAVSGGLFYGATDVVLAKLSPSGSVLSVFQRRLLNTGGSEGSSQIRIDYDGQLVGAYTTNSIVSGGTNLGSNDIVVFRALVENAKPSGYSAASDVAWIKQASMFGALGSTSQHSSFTDASGNTYISWTSASAPSGGTLVGSTDICVAELDSNGGLVWIRQLPVMNTTAEELRSSITADTNGNAYVAYLTASNVSGGTYMGGAYDLSIAKLDTLGRLVWVRMVAAMNSSGIESAPSIATNASGEVYVAYTTTGTVSGGTQSGGATSIVVLRMNTNGQLVWTRQQQTFNAAGTNTEPNIVVDAGGTSTVVYTTNATVSGGTNRGGSDIAVFQMTINGALLWVRQYANLNTTADEYAPVVARHAATGNLFVAYITSGATSSGTLIGKKDIVVARMLPDGQIVWIKQVQGVNTLEDDLDPSIALDAFGNVYVAYATDSAAQGGINIGMSDIAIAKLDYRTGSTIWIKQQSALSTTSVDSTPHIGLDRDRGIYLTYATVGTVSGGTNRVGSDIAVAKLLETGYDLAGEETVGVTSLRQLTSGIYVDRTRFGTVALKQDADKNSYLSFYTRGQFSGGQFQAGQDQADAAIAKLAPNGGTLWIKSFAAMNTVGWDGVGPIGLDASGNVYFATSTIGRPVSGGILTGDYDLAISKITTDGALVWVKQLPVWNTTVGDGAHSIIVDNSGNVYCFGTTAGTLSGGTNLGSNDYMIIKLDTDGNVLWVKQDPPLVSSLDQSTLNAIYVDASNNIYGVHRVSGAVSGAIGYGGYDIVFFKMTSEGAIEWMKQHATLNTSGNDAIPSAVVKNNAIYIAYSVDVAVSGGAQLGGSDIVVAKLDMEADVIWMRQQPFMNTANSEFSPSIAVNDNDEIYVAYTTSSAVSGGTAGGSQDIAVAKLSPTGDLVWVKQPPGINTASNESIPLVAIDTDGYPVVYYSMFGGPVSGGYSNEDLIVMKLGPLPATPLVPSNVTVTLSNQDNAYSVSWYNIGYYAIVYRDTNAYGSTKTRVGGPIFGSSSYLDRTVSAGVQYYYFVAFYSNGVEGPPSAGVKATPLLINPIAWVKQLPSINTTVDDSAPRAKVGRDGYIYLTYHTAGTTSGGSSRGGYDIVVLKLDKDGTIVWSRQHAINTSSNDTWPSIDVDREGSVYLAYRTDGGTVSGGTFFGGTSDIVVMKLNTDGNIVWMRQRPEFNTSSGTPTDPYVGVDNAGNCYVLMVTDSAASGGIFKGSYDIVMFKLDANGNTVWVIQPQLLNTSQSEQNASLAVDGSGNSYVSYFVNQAMSGGVFLGNVDTVVAKFDTDGNNVWLTQNPNTNTGALDRDPVQLVVDASSNVYVSYRIDSNNAISGGINSGASDAVLYKLDSNGVLVWARQRPIMNTGNHEYPRAIIVDRDQCVYAAGIVSGASTGGFPMGNNDMYLYKLSRDGEPLWAKQTLPMNTNSHEEQSRIVVDELYNIYVFSMASSTVSGGTYLGSNDIIYMKILQPAPTQIVTNVAVVSSPNDGGARLTWDTTGFEHRVYRDTQLSGATKVLIGSTVSSMYEDRSVLPGVRYYYFVAAFNAGVEGPMAPAVRYDGTLATVLWSRQIAPFNTNGSDTWGRMAYDSSGNVYVAYLTGGTISGGTNKGGIDFSLMKLAPNGTVLWIKQLFDFSSTGGENNITITVDASGNVVLGGVASATISGGTHMGQNDIIVGKFDGNGNSIWLQQSPIWNTTSPEDSVASIKTDASNNIYLSWHNYQTRVSGGVNVGNNYDIVVMKMTADGGIAWLKQDRFTSTPNSDTSPNLGLDAQGNVYIAYTTDGRASGGTTMGGNDIVVVKLDTNGNSIWIRQVPPINTPGADQSVWIDVDASGTIYMAYITNSVVSGGSSMGNFDIAVAKMNTDGQILWVRQYAAMNSSLQDDTPRIFADAQGNAYVSYLARAAISGGVFAGNFDVVISKLDTNGNLVWTFQKLMLNTGGEDYLSQLLIGNDGTLYGAGITNQTISGGGNSGNYDIYVFRMSLASTNGLPAVEPMPPTDVFATVGNTVARVLWTPPLSNGGMPITSYTIKAYPGGYTSTVAAPASAGYVSGLLNGYRYTFTVTATNSVGTSQESLPSVAIPGYVAGVEAGLSYSLYTGYFNNVLSWFDTATLLSVSAAQAEGFSSNQGIAPTPRVNATTTIYSAMYTGSFVPPRAGYWRFSLYSDDRAYLWVGTNATSGFTTSNANAAPNVSIATTSSFLYSASQVVPIRIVWGNSAGAGYLQVRIEYSSDNSTWTEVSSYLESGAGYFYRLVEPTTYITNYDGAYVDPVLTNIVETAKADERQLALYVNASPKTSTDLYLELRRSLALGSTAAYGRANSILTAFINSIRADAASSLLNLTANQSSLVMASSATDARFVASKPITVVLPQYTNREARVDLTNLSIATDGSRYLHFEIPPSSTLTLTLNGATKRLRYDGTSLMDGQNTYRLLSRIQFGDRMYQVVGLGSLTLDTDVQQVKTTVRSSGQVRIRFLGNMRLAGAPSRPPFVVYAAPLLVANLRLWLDADDSTTVYDAQEGGNLATVGTSVARWEDKSGHGQHAIQSTASNRPTRFATLNGRAGMNFALNQWFRGSFVTANTSKTLSAIVVFSMDSTTQDSGRLLSLSASNAADSASSAGGTAIARNATNAKLQSNANGNTTNMPIADIAYNTSYIVSAVYNGTNQVLYLNGASVGTQAHTANFNTALYGIGFNSYTSPASTDRWVGAINEVVLYDTALSAADRTRIEGYMAWKWGIQSSLDAGHPYKTSPPNDVAT